MTSDEIRATIDRLKAMPCDDTQSVYVVTGTFMDMDMNGSYSAIGLRNRLIGLLEQADPDTHMELPRDADGVPINIGDEMQWSGGDRFSVVAIGDDAVYFDDGDGYEYSTPDDVRHYHKPTFEDVVRDMLNDVVCMFDASGGCSAWMTDTKVHEYAEKLREVMQDE